MSHLFQASLFASAGSPVVQANQNTDTVFCSGPQECHCVNSSTSSPLCLHDMESPSQLPVVLESDRHGSLCSFMNGQDVPNTPVIAFTVHFIKLNSKKWLSHCQTLVLQHNKAHEKSVLAAHLIGLAKDNYDCLAQCTSAFQNEIDDDENKANDIKAANTQDFNDAVEQLRQEFEHKLQQDLAPLNKKKAGNKKQAEAFDDCIHSNIMDCTCNSRKKSQADSNKVIIFAEIATMECMKVCDHARHLRVKLTQVKLRGNAL